MKGAFVGWTVIALGLGLASPALAQTVAHPVKITAADPAALTTSDTVRQEKDGHVTHDRLMGATPDKKTFTAGMYSATASRENVESYSVDEFMYFIKGGVTLTSADGTVTQINPGDAVFIQKGWKGVWDTPGYTKYYVIYEPAN